MLSLKVCNLVQSHLTVDKNFNHVAVNYLFFQFFLACFFYSIRFPLVFKIFYYSLFCRGMGDVVVNISVINKLVTVI